MLEHNNARRDTPWAKPVLWGNEEAYVLEALRSTWISGGPFVERFESELGRYLDCKHAIAVANGTSALHLAYLALGLKPGDDVVVPGFAFMAAANIALQLGLRPVFCDVDPNTWCMGPSNVRPVLTANTKAIVAVHSYGNTCEMSELLGLGRQYGIPIIEDAAEALGSRIAGHAAGSLGAINTFSFHATKTIATGEGGLVTTDDDKLAETARLFRSHGLRRQRHYWHEVPGHNFRITNLQAAIGCAQFEHIEQICAQRRRVFSHYEARLRELPGVALQGITKDSQPLIWAVAVRLSPQAYPKGRDATLAALAERGIETRPGFQPPSEMPYFDVDASQFPVSDDLGRWVLSLPTFPTLQDERIDWICDCLSALGHV